MIKHKKLIIVPQSLRQLLLENAHDLLDTQTWIGHLPDSLLGGYGQRCLPLLQLLHDM